MRPSHGILPVDGYIPSFRWLRCSYLLAKISNMRSHHRQFDVPCFYGRDIKKCRIFASHWYGDRLTEIPKVGP